MGVWKRKNEEEIPNKKVGEKIYELIKVITQFWNYYEILEVNNNYFLCLMRDYNLKFFDCDEVNEIKTIKIKF